MTLRNFVVNLVVGEPKEKSTTAILYPISDYDNGHRFSEKHIAYVTAIVSTVEPKSFREAMKDKQ